MSEKVVVYLHLPSHSPCSSLTFLLPFSRFPHPLPFCHLPQSPSSSSPLASHLPPLNLLPPPSLLLSFLLSPLTSRLISHLPSHLSIPSPPHLSPPISPLTSYLTFHLPSHLSIPSSLLSPHRRSPHLQLLSFSLDTLPPLSLILNPPLTSPAPFLPSPLPPQPYRQRTPSSLPCQPSPRQVLMAGGLC